MFMKLILGTFLECIHLFQVYESFDADSIADVDDARLEYFSKKVRFLYCSGPSGLQNAFHTGDKKV